MMRLPTRMGGIWHVIGLSVGIPHRQQIKHYHLIKMINPPKASQ